MFSRVVLENLSPIPAPFSIEIDERGAVQKLIDSIGRRRYFLNQSSGEGQDTRSLRWGRPLRT